MTVNVFYQTDIPGYLRRTGLFKTAVQKALKQAAEPNTEVNVVFVDKKEILKINKEFLNHHYVTDVISFNNERPPFDTGEPWAFGDIYVCYPVAREQAKHFGHTILQEMLMYAAHGALHLSGMDDHAPEDRAKMDRRAENIIRAVLR